MKRKLHKTKSFLQYCAGLNCKLRKGTIQNTDKETLDGVSELILNLIHGNIVIPSHLKSAIKKHKKTLLLLSRKKSSLKQRKKALQSQRGGFLGMLASILIPAITGLISTITK